MQNRSHRPCYGTAALGCLGMALRVAGRRRRATPGGSSAPTRPHRLLLVILLNGDRPNSFVGSVFFRKPVAAGLLNLFLCFFERCSPSFRFFFEQFDFNISLPVDLPAVGLRSLVINASSFRANSSSQKCVLHEVFDPMSPFQRTCAQHVSLFRRASARHDCC